MKYMIMFEATMAVVQRNLAGTEAPARCTGTTGSPVNDGVRDPLLEHWDGTQWTIVSTPRPDKAYNCGFFGAAATAGRAHAVGACIASDAETQPHAVPLAATSPAVSGGGATAPAAPSALTATATSRRRSG